MNRHKKDLFSGCEKLKSESLLTVQLLDSLIEKNVRDVETIIGYNQKQFHSNANVYQEVLRNQNFMLEKLSCLNIELEGMVDTNATIEPSLVYNVSRISKLDEIDTSPLNSRCSSILQRSLVSLLDTHKTEISVLTDNVDNFTQSRNPSVHNESMRRFEEHFNRQDVKTNTPNENSNRCEENISRFMENLNMHNENLNRRDGDTDKFDENYHKPKHESGEINLPATSSRNASEYDQKEIASEEPIENIFKNNQSLIECSENKVDLPVEINAPAASSNITNKQESEEMNIPISKKTDQRAITSEKHSENGYKNNEGLIVYNENTGVSPVEINAPVITSKSSNEDDFETTASDKINFVPAEYYAESEISESSQERLEMTEDEVETINEKLRKDRFLSRQDKYIEKLPRYNMPDLTFKRELYSSSEYLSATSAEDEAPRSKKGESFSHELDIPDPTMPNKLDFCIISSFESPSEFYINVANEEVELLDSLTLQLREVCENKRPFRSKEQAKEVIKKYCIAYSEQFKNFYRARIIDWYAGDCQLNNNIKLQFVDYGDYLTTSYKFLYPLPSSLAKIPKMCIKCHLAFLYPIGSTEENKIRVWSQRSLASFKALISTMENYYNIVYLEKTSLSVAIDLIPFEDVQKDISLCDKMIHCGAGIQLISKHEKLTGDLIKKQISTAQGVHGVKSNMSSDQVMEVYFNNLQAEDEPNSVEEAVTNYEATDEARICRFTRADNTCFKGANCKLDHMQIRKDGITTDQLSTYTRPLQGMPIPRISDEVDIFITSICAIDQFYAQVHTFFPGGKGLKMLNQLINSKNEMEQFKSYKVFPAIGELVIAKHWDNLWYRGMVLEVDTNMSTPEVVIKVLFIDYGEKMDVLFRNVKQITPKFLQLPFQAIKCILSNIVPKNNLMTSKEKEYLEEKYLYKNMKASIVYVSDATWAVKVQNVEGTDLGQQIVQDGYANHGEKHFPDPRATLLVD